jgi:transposase InsO family protein
MKANRGLTVRHMVELGGVSRASFYRFDEEGATRVDRDMDLRDAIQRIALKWPSYGRPRIAAELRRQGWRVGPNRVRRLMREDNLLCVRKRKFVVTTDSNHGRKVYPNLAGEMELSGINQLWVADITYIRLEREFVYLAVVIDAFSRRVIGWALERTLEDDLPLQALRMALEQRQPGSGLVHHSDRGGQYASNEYTGLLKVQGCRISMSHKATVVNGNYSGCCSASRLAALSNASNRLSLRRSSYKGSALSIRLISRCSAAFRSHSNARSRSPRPR